MGKILSRHETKVSRWVRLVTKEVESDDGRIETYHMIGQSDYVAILARTDSGLIPLVRQYRPAVEDYTYELPAGLVESGETPEETCRRELLEETGLNAQTITSMCEYWADTGRLENRLHNFFVTAPDPVQHFSPEPGMSVEFTSPDGLREYIAAGRFKHQLHIALLAIADVMRPGWDD
jgi:ADP-ribose pyrophosphatase